jgi:hypothetical protein
LFPASYLGTNVVNTGCSRVGAGGECGLEVEDVFGIGAVVF